MLTAVRAGLAEGLEVVLKASFQLTPTECQVLDGLAAGLDIATLAGAQGRAVATTRQHVKAILAKLNVQSQAQAVALVMSASAALSRKPVAILADGDCPLVRSRIGIGQGREIAIRRFGDPSGLPLVYIHGSLFGIGTLPAMRRAAAILGLNVFAAERPGFGDTPFSAGDADVMDTAARDVIGMMDHFGIARAVLVCEGVAIIPAFRLALAIPERICGIVAASIAVPLTNWNRTRSIPARQRIQMWTARKAPSLSSGLIAIGHAIVRARGYSTFPDLVFGTSGFDRDTWLEPQYYPCIEDACKLNMQQGVRPGREDLLAATHDWSTLAEAVNVPVRFLHGRHSETIELGEVEHLKNLVPGASVEVVEDAGHTIILSHHALVLRRALELAWGR